MQIIRIEELDRKRIRVTFEGGCEFALYKGEGKRYGLQEGRELAEDQFLEIRGEILIKRARLRAMHLLEKMDRTEEQLRMKLRQGYYPQDVIEDALDYVKGYHYVDDLRYAQNYVRRHKGVSKDLAAQALEEECGRENEHEQILQWVRKRNYSSREADLKEKQKMYQFLMRKGFCPNEILHVLDHLT